MNTLDAAFDKWLSERGPAHLRDDDVRTAFNAGFLAGFDYAKAEAIRAMDGALKEPTSL